METRPGAARPGQIPAPSAVSAGRRGSCESLGLWKGSPRTRPAEGSWCCLANGHKPRFLPGGPSVDGGGGSVIPSKGAPRGIFPFSPLGLGWGLTTPPRCGVLCALSSRRPIPQRPVGGKEPLPRCSSPAVAPPRPRPWMQAREQAQALRPWAGFTSFHQVQLLSDLGMSFH